MRPVFVIAALLVPALCDAHPVAPQAYAAPPPLVWQQQAVQPAYYTPPQPAGVWVAYRRPTPLGDLLLGPVWIWLPIHRGCPPAAPAPPSSAYESPLPSPP